jgi:NAD(P)H-flavin reductase
MPKKIFSLLSSLFNKEVTISYKNTENALHQITLQRNTNLLEGLIRADIPVSYSCRAGQCLSCVMLTSNPELLPEITQRDLSDAEKELGHFLPCVCPASHDMDIQSLSSANPILESEVIERTLLPQNILLLKLKAPFEFRAGQFVNLYKDENTFRSYSIASSSHDKLLEFHIKVIENGEFSSWASDTLKVGNHINIQGPYGKCIYTKTESSSPILLCGIGTGLAPLIGITKDALAQDSEASIDLVIGARNANGFYLQEELKELEQQYSNVSLHWLCADNSDAHEPRVIEGDIYDFVKDTYQNLKEHKVYLCGAESFVRKMKKTCYLNDAALKNIMSDVFTPSH